MKGTKRITTTTPEDIEALWYNITVSATTPGQAFAWIARNAENWGSYMVTLEGGAYELPPNNALFFESKFVRIFLKADSPVTIILTSGEKGCLISVCKNAYLVLGNNITLKGIYNNTDPLVQVLDKGGGGVQAVQNSTFTMSGETIRNNITQSDGGGIYLGSESSLRKSGLSVIENNISNGDGNAVYTDLKYRNPDIPAGEDSSAEWNTDTNSYDYEGTWDN